MMLDQANMARWEHPIAIDPTAALPVFLQIARAIAEDVRRGRLRAGEKLPGSRTLAGAVGVHRNTVLAAYRELAAEGWIETRPAGGTFVSNEIGSPLHRDPRRGQRLEPRLGFDLPPSSLDDPRVPEVPRGTLTLAAGTPDSRLFPTGAIARAYRRALELHGATSLGYGDPRGVLPLRKQLGAMLSSLRGLAVDDLLITRGSQGALDLVARTLLRPGDVIAVEALGYRPAWGAFQAAGALLVPIPVDEHGLRVDALAEHAGAVRAVYVTPHHQYPTTATLSPGRRLALLELARTRRFAIVEDDFDFEFHYEGRPVLPLASADRAGVVVYVGTLSKILAPGVRTGFVVAPAPLLDRMAALRMVVDRQGDPVVELAIAELLEDGEVQRHARRIRRIYLERRDTLLEALHAKLASVVTVDPPGGGMAAWIRVDPSVDVVEWSERSLRAGVAFAPAKNFAFDGRSRPFARLGFAALDVRELREAVSRMASALPSKKRRSA